MKKNILFLITSLDFGGAEAQVVQLATQLQGRGWQARVVSLLPARAYAEELTAAGVEVACLGMRRGVVDPWALLRLARLLRRWRPQIVHSHMVHANVLARVTRALHPLTVLVSTAHSINEGGRLRELAYRATDPLCDLTTNVSQAAVDRYIQVGAAPRRKIRFVPNGVDTDRFRPDEAARLRLRAELGLEGAFAWLAVGRFEAAKDYPTMIRAFAQTAATQPQARLLLVGQGHLEGDVRQLVAELGVTEQVRFLGVRRDIPALMNAADAYVMSSAWEGLPMVLLEAAAVGLPIVATAVGGNPEVVLAEKTGRLVPPGDPEQLGAAMRWLQELPTSQRQALGRAGHLHSVASYSLTHVVDQWESLYRELWEAHAPAG